jgi:hypothetical protein
MRKLLCSFPVLLALILASTAVATAQTAPDTDGAALNAAAQDVPETDALSPADPALVQPGPVPEPIAASVLPVTCYSTCQDGTSGVGTCKGTLAFCCAANRRLYCAHFGGGYLYGYCTDGTSSLAC